MYVRVTKSVCAGAGVRLRVTVLSESLCAVAVTLTVFWRLETLRGARWTPCVCHTAHSFPTRRCLPSRLCSSCRLPVLRSTAAAAATEHGTELSKAEVTLVFEQYMEDLKTELRPDQLGKKWTCYKSCTEAKNETHGWTHLRGQRHLDDRPSSSALVCYRAARSAAIPTRPGSRPRRHSQC